MHAKTGMRVIGKGLIGALVASCLYNPSAGARHIERLAVASLDYCADQYVMALMQPNSNIALSPDAGSNFSFQASRAAGFGRIRISDEALIANAPQRVVREWGGGLSINDYLGKFDIEVVQIQYGNTLEHARSEIGRVGAALGLPEETVQLVSDFDARRARLKADPVRSSVTALYITAGGATAGRDTFIDDIFKTAGVTNFMASKGLSGWAMLDVEDLVDAKPDLIVGAFFDLETSRANFFSLARHSFFTAVTKRVPTVFIPSALVSCNGWFSIGAAERIHEHAKMIARGHVAEIGLKPDQREGAN